MKKFYYLLAGITMILVTIIACEQASIEVDELQAIQEIEMSAKGPKADKVKVDICHWDDGLVWDDVQQLYVEDHDPQWVSITIAPEALQKHMDNHGDKFPYSPEGTFTLYRPNGAFVNITITSFDGTTAIVSGSGRNAHKWDHSVRYFVGATIVVEPDGNFLMTIPQSVSEGGLVKGTHVIGGLVSKCGGDISDLSDEHTITNNNNPISPYSLTPYENVIYTPVLLP